MGRKHECDGTLCKIRHHRGRCGFMLGHGAAAPSEPAVQPPMQPDERDIAAAVAAIDAAVEARPVIELDADELRIQCTVLKDVCAALEPGEDPRSNALLQELQQGVARAQETLHSKMVLVTDEAALMDALALNDLVAGALAVYSQRMEEGASVVAPPVVPVVEAAPIASEDLELMDLLGMPATQPAAQPALVKTKSEEDFDDFFSGRSTPCATNTRGIFSPRATVRVVT